MPWWGWITIGALMLAAELTLVDLEFYLILLGASALVTGLTVLSGAPLPYWAQWLLFAALAVASLGLFRSALYDKLHPPPEDVVRDGVEGRLATAETALAPGTTGTVQLRGSTWSARNVGDGAIQAGGRCRVVQRDGLTLDVRSES